MKPQMIMQVPLDLIDEAPQVREHFDSESLLALAATIRAHGIQQPVTLRRTGERYVVVMGGRRCRAARTAGETHVPGRVMEGDLSEAELLELQLLENTAREDLNPVDRARAFTKWMSLTGRTAGELARITGVSAPVLSKLSAMLVLAPDVLALVESRKLPYSAAAEIAKFSDPAEQRRLAAQVVNGGLSRDKLVAQSKAIRATRGVSRPRKPRQPRRPAPRLAVPLGNGRTVSVPMREAVTFDRFIAWIEQVLNSAKELHAKGLGLPEAVKALASQSR